MPRVCVVCKRQQSSALSVFRFPSSLDHQASWVRIIRNAYSDFAKSQDDMDRHMKNGICEMHFDKKDYFRGKQKCRLKKDAIPLVATMINSSVNLPGENSCRDKFTQTDPGNLFELQNNYGEENQIRICAVCRKSEVSYGYLLIDCDKSVLHIVSEVCLLDRMSYESEICTGCIAIIRDIVEFKKEIKYRTQLLMNLSNGSIASNICKLDQENLIKKFNAVVRSEAPKMVTANMSNYSSDHKKKTTFTCSVCLKIFYIRHLYLLHEANHKQCFDCVICGRYLSTKAGLQLHLYKFHYIGETKKQLHRCSFCDSAFSTKQGLKYHLTVIHTNNAPYTCGKCNKAFKSSLLYKSHLLFSHGEKNIQCDLCEKKFFTVSKRNNHVNTVHRKAATWLCRLCGSTFTSNTSFRHHVRSKHDTDPFKCNRCPSVFRKKSALRNHMYKHNVYTCVNCNLFFTDHDTFNVHASGCQKRDSLLRKYDSGLGIFDDYNYADNNSVIPIESIKLIGDMDKTSDADLSNDMPLVNVHLLDEINTSHGQSMHHSIEPLCSTDIFESDLSSMQERIVGSEIQSLPLRGSIEKIQQLHLQHGNEKDVSNLSLIENIESKPRILLPLPKVEESQIKSLHLQTTTENEINPVLQHTHGIEFHNLHFNETDENNTSGLPLQQIIEVEIPALPLSANVECSMNDLNAQNNDVIDGLTHSSNDMSDLSFSDYHERVLPLESSMDHKSFDSNVLSDHMAQIDPESEMCNLTRDKDWNLPLVLDQSDVQTISFGTGNITPTIDIPLCQEPNALVDRDTSLDRHLSEYSLPVRTTDEPEYVIHYLNTSDGNVK